MINSNFCCCIGLLHDHSHNSGAGVFVREFRDQSSLVQLQGTDRPCSGHIPTG